MIPFPGTLFSLRCHSWVSGTTCDDQLRLAHLQKRSVRCQEAPRGRRLSSKSQPSGELAGNDAVSREAVWRILHGTVFFPEVQRLLSRPYVWGTLM